MTKIFAIAAVALLAACGSKDAGEGEVVSDTTVTTIEGTDTMTAPVVVPTTDTVTTTTTVTTDTTAGTPATDSAPAQH